MGAGGRPRKWNSPNKMQEAIDEYFTKCEGTLLVDVETNQPVFTKNGQPIYINRKPPTVTGLALHLGFAATQSLFDYAKDERFSAIISRAKLRIESYLEERLMDRDGQRGAEFNLRCNYGWTDKREININTDDNTGVIFMVPVKEEPEEQKEEENVQAI